jgi:hypothetical protein
VTIKTEPPGAQVHGPGFRSRTTPATVEAPCGPITLTIDHPRYMRIERTVRLTAGDRESVYERLERPGAVLTLKSNPPGAAFVVNGRDVGRAPTRAAVNAFTTVTVKAVLDGYAPVVQRYYVRGTSAAFEAYLDGSGRTNTRASRSALRRSPKPEL